MSIAFVTMVYNDAFFLEIWLRHYLKYTQPEHIYVVTHGPQPYAHEMAKGCNIIEIERDPRNPRLDQDRFVYLSQFCSELTASYDRVIWNDVDEIVMLDPLMGSDLTGYIDAIPKKQKVVTPLGLEVIHRTDLESDYDYARGMFAQRRFLRCNGWYTKPNITSVPIVWGPDGHGSSHNKIHLDPHLYTFHLKWFDYNFHRNRHRERLKFRFDDEAGNEVIIGAGSWSWSEATYVIVSNSFLRMRIKSDEGAFDFSHLRERILASFVGGANGKYRISWFADGTLHPLPERFIGLI
ncbi:hypothetical protein QWZ10_07110 [Paracoccus cavernae]|uniref:Glycosyltransferase family 2 protein n=1 Tax=Paracoccus cavernae TaxID=1571207 RepID=A0ABT8D8S3_9RHOB|nr:hypothetical protein [Paracoccus cavernae]